MILVWLWVSYLFASGQEHGKLRAIGPARCHTVECQKDGF